MGFLSALVLTAMVGGAKPAPRAVLRPRRPAPVHVHVPVTNHVRPTGNVRLNPLGLLFGTYDLGVDLTLGSAWTLGPMIRFASTTGTFDDVGTEYAVKYLGFGLRGTWFYNGVLTRGLYLAPTLTYVNAGVTVRDRFGQSTEYSASGFMIGGLIGYGWFWDHFNLMVGGGLDVTFGPQTIRVRESGGTSESLRTTLAGLAVETSVGWTF